jgi:hypothetical protein
MFARGGGTSAESFSAIRADGSAEMLLDTDEAEEDTSGWFTSQADFKAGPWRKISMGQYPVGLYDDGHVVVWGTRESAPYDGGYLDGIWSVDSVAPTRIFSDVSAYSGYYSSPDWCAVRDDTRLVCWGSIDVVWETLGRRPCRPEIPDPFCLMEPDELATW